MNVDEAAKIITFLESHGVALQWWNYVLIAVLAILGGYVGSYFQKKGELKAISRDFESILDQVKQQTLETQAIKDGFERQFSLFESEREWEEKVVSELLGPLYMQFDRTRRAKQRWDQKSIYIEVDVMKEGNTTNRDMLLTKGHLIPSDLLEHAGSLIDHYDHWLEELANVQARRAAGEDVEFVHTFDFPVESEQAFSKRFIEMRKQLYKHG